MKSYMSRILQEQKPITGTSYNLYVPDLSCNTIHILEGRTTRTIRRAENGLFRFGDVNPIGKMFRILGSLYILSESSLDIVYQAKETEHERVYIL